VPARWHRVNARRGAVLALLRDDHKVMGEPGTNRGGYFTEFRYTMRLVAEWVAAHPGCTVRDAMANVEHHYASDRGARQGLCVAIRGGLCEGVRLDGEAGPLRLYPVAEAERIGGGRG
jgi:hypothetical protein